VFRRQLDDSDVRRCVKKRLRDLVCVATARRVVVGDYGNAAPAERFAILLAPLPSTLGVGGSYQVGRPHAVHVLLALGDEHPLVGVRLHEFGQAVEDPLHPVEVPDVPALAVGPPLAEVLRLVADHLVADLSVAGHVWVCFDDAPRSAARRPAVRLPEVWWEEVLYPEADRHADGLNAAAGVAVQEHPPIVARGHGKAGFPIVMGGAAGFPPAGADRPHAIESVEDVTGPADLHGCSLRTLEMRLANPCLVQRAVNHRRRSFSGGRG
jgi:hypothetical protein